MPEQKQPSRPFFMPKCLSDWPEESCNGKGSDDWDWDLLRAMIPNMDNVAIEDDTPLDTIQTEKQQRLLTEPLYISWVGPGEGRSILAMANVGLFYFENQPPLVPDVMLAIDVPLFDFSDRENRTYCTWKRTKVPDAALEIVSDRLGGEETHKLTKYAQAGVPYYVVYDPYKRIGQEKLRVYILRPETGKYERTDSSWMERVGLGLTLWEGVYEDHPALWLRWCDQQGNLIPTGREKVEQERARAEQERARAEQEHARADEERQKRERLEAQLRALGIEPSA